MAARRIKGSPMKYWGFYASEELKATTIECAKKLDVADSEYIRLAVEHYNTHHQQDREPKCVNCGSTKIMNGSCGACGFIQKYGEQSKPTMVKSFAKGGK